MTDYPYKSKIEEAVATFPRRFLTLSSGPREYLLQNKCKADFCFPMSPRGILFVEDDDAARAINNLIKYWIWAEKHPDYQPIHLIHIVETSRPAQVENLKFLAGKMQQFVSNFTFHLITLDNWQLPDETWLPRFRETVKKIAEDKICGANKGV